MYNRIYYLHQKMYRQTYIILGSMKKMMYVIYMMYVSPIYRLCIFLKTALKKYFLIPSKNKKNTLIVLPWS
jgi:hypothetical protein